ncbi:ParB N-terminal domain-containing protein [Rhodopila sp.]|uniref:ParB N-terminal domain-containing protein n=1 Tax=Rhodopila sp. TaxID=2480087 RepID=UPI003D0D5D09
MLIRIDAVHENGNSRRMKASAAADAALTASIQAQGVLQPILVRTARPSDDVCANGSGFVLVAGARRLRCARAAGLDEIPAEVGRMTEGWALAAQAAENMVRVPMHPTDQWRAVRDLVAGGFTFANAAAALGLDDRQTRRMERLGLLDPKLLALIEAGDEMPTDGELRIIASAPRAMQAKAVKSKDAIWRRGDEQRVSWHAIAHACRVTRYFRGNALFDADAMTWDVDFFAQPGSDEEYTSTDGETFMRLQRQALESQVADAQARKQRVQLVDFDSNNHTPKLPVGFKRVWTGDVEKPKRVECVFVTLDDMGVVKRILAEDTKAVKAAEARKVEKAKTATGDPTGEAVEDDADDEAAEVPAAVVEKPGLTKAGLTMVNAAKTQALRETLCTGLTEMPAERLLVLMVLAWGALNVSVSNVAAGDNSYEQRNFRDIAARVLLPGGGLDEVSMADARGYAGEVMARVLSFGVAGLYYSSSGAPAEWIGAAIDANQAMPRFDTEDFLKQVGGDELRRVALAFGERATGTVAALRARLVGRLPAWRPDAAAFGAPAPVVRHG